MHKQRKRPEDTFFIRYKNTRGVKVPLHKLVDFWDGIANALDQRIPSGALPETDRQRIVEIVFGRVCELTSPSGGNFPREALLSNFSWYDREILSAMQTLMEERALARTRAVLAATSEVLGHIITGLDDLASKLEEASKA